MLERDKARDAFDLMAREYQRVLYSAAYRILGNASLASDALQQTFVDALRDVKGYQGRSPIRAWLLTICSHRAIDLARKERRSEQWHAPEEMADDVPENVPQELSLALDDKRRARALEECLLTLSVEVRTALILRFQHGMSYEEISKVCDVKPGTLQARVMRAMPFLLRCLVSKGWGR